MHRSHRLIDTHKPLRRRHFSSHNNIDVPCLDLLPLSEALPVSWLDPSHVGRLSSLFCLFTGFFRCGLLCVRALQPFWLDTCDLLKAIIVCVADDDRQDAVGDCCSSASFRSLPLVENAQMIMAIMNSLSCNSGVRRWSFCYHLRLRSRISLDNALCWILNEM